MEFTKTPAILIATHGLFCEELVKTAGLLYGSTVDVRALPLLPDMTPDDYQERLEQVIEQYGGDVIVMVDVVGGTPFNTLMRIGRDRPLCAVAGVNIPMVLEALDQRDTARDGRAFAANVAEVAQASVRDITPNLERFFDMAREEK